MSDTSLKIDWPTFMNRHLVNFIVMLFGLSAAYFTTIGSIKAELAAKAETVLVNTIDQRLAQMEVLIREGLINKDDFFKFQSSVESRLTRIESHLIDNKGDKK
jgi:hypothetical protein